jgi:hypothetical protein
MKITDFFEDKYTVIFVLILVLLVSIWISRTYRNGGFGTWIAPSEGYGTGVIEGLAVADHEKVRYDGMILTQEFHAPAGVIPPDSSKTGSLILNKCSFVKDSFTTFRFFFTTAEPLRGATGDRIGTNAAKIITIKVPTRYIKNTNTNGLSVSMRAYGGLSLPPTVGTAAGTGTVLDDSPSISASVIDEFVVITYTIGTTNPIAAGKYALELSGLQWNDEIAAAPSTASLANVSLESNAEAAGSQKLVLVNLWPSSDATKQVRIFADTAYAGLATFLSCRKISTESPQLSPNYTGTATTFSIRMMLTNGLMAGDHVLIQLPKMLQTTGVFIGINIDNAGTNLSSYEDKTLDVVSSGVENPYGGLHNSLHFRVPTTSAPATVIIAANVTLVLTITGLRTPADATSSTDVIIRTFRAGAANMSFVTNENVLDSGMFTLEAIPKRPDTSTSSGTPTSSGTASDGTTYVTAAASSVLISDVKRQMNWAIEAQKDYESAYRALRAATTTTAKTDAQLKYDVAIARRNRLIASHPDSWYDGANWRYGDDGHVRKCAEPSNLSSNEGNCQSIYRLDASGNVVKSADGNNILLMRKCPWKCNNPGQTGSDACRIDADCLKVIRWATYLPDGTQIEKNLLATTRSSYDDIARDTSSSSLDDDDIYRRGITRNFSGYRRGRPPGQPSGQSPGLFGTIRDATGNIIRGIGNWIDPNDRSANQRTDRHNAYYYEDGSPAATAYLGMYNGQGYEEESPFYGAAKPTSYYYTTNYYYTDGEAGGGANDGKSNMPGKLSNVKPYEQTIDF